jgi:thiamine-phosphate pyrophosphorylase
VPARLPPAPFAYPIVDATTVGEAAVVGLIEAFAAAGMRLLQLRAKDAPDGVFHALARASVAAAHRHGALLIVNDRADVARLAGADGVHVGQDDLSPEEVRAILGAEAIVGLSTHALDQLARGLHAPIDYVAVGPVFPTPSKKNPDPLVGLELVTQARQATTLPLVAIGGITRANAPSVVAAGADGVAVISDLLRAADPVAAARALETALRRQ